MSFSEELIEWYENNKRDLPWRNTSDPYKIWLSEIILQQTRVKQGLNYYLKFTEKYKTINEFAEAPEDEILKLWQGMGYYNRALNALQAAREVVSRFHGQFPSDYHEMIQLKGVGEYTAAAILSIAYGRPYAVVDGNVKRFFSRFFGFAANMSAKSGENIVREKAQKLMDMGMPGEFNQAMMEFGALICTPKSPDCTQCPFKLSCVAWKDKMVNHYPVKSQPKKQKVRYFHYFIITDKEQSRVWIHKRDASDIWKKMYELPLIETQRGMSIKQLKKLEKWAELFDHADFMVSEEVKSYRHVLTHRVIRADFYRITLSGGFILPGDLLMIPLNELRRYPFPRIIEKFLSDSGFF